VVVGVVVALPFMTRPVCLPVACRRWQGKGTASAEQLAGAMVATSAARLPGRRLDVVADAAYHGRQVRSLPEQVTWTTRVPRNATRYGRAPQRTGKRGRPRLKGDKLGKPAQVAADLAWQVVSVARYGRVQNVRTAVLDCLWYGPFGPVPVRLVCVRDRDDPKAPMLALVTADLTSSVADLVARYAMRWAIEVTFFDCRQSLGVGQAHNHESRVRKPWVWACWRTVPNCTRSASSPGSWCVPTGPPP
jgi:Transposase DDE domain